MPEKLYFIEFSEFPELVVENPSLSASPSKNSSKTADLLKSKGFPDDRLYTRSVHRWSRRSALPSGIRKSGIYLFRKRIHERLKEAVGDSEIKFSLRTRDPAVARIRNLEEMVRLERAWSGIDGRLVDTIGSVAASHSECANGRSSASAAVEPASERIDPPPIDTSSIDASWVDRAGEAGPLTPAKPLRSIFNSYAKAAELAPSTG